MNDEETILALYASWCSFQIAAGQEYNTVITVAQRKSYMDSIVRFKENPNRTPQESHEMWLAHKKKEGWVHGEIKSESLKTHPDILPFGELPEMEQRKNIMHITSLELIVGEKEK